MTDKSTLFIRVIIWFLLTVFIGIMGVNDILPGIVKLYDLSKSYEMTKAEIIETYPRMHSTCKYKYSVKNIEYTSVGRSCGDFLVGQKISVYFAHDNPNESVNWVPRSLLMNDLIPFILALITFPILAAMSVPRSKK